MIFNPVSVIAIICITILLIVAMVNGINGVALAGGFTIIGGLGGYSIRRKKDNSKGNYWR